MLMSAGKKIIMFNKIARQILLTILKTLNRTPLAFRHRVLLLLRSIAAIFLTDRVFFKLERYTRKIAKRELALGPGSNYTPKRKRLSWKTVHSPEAGSKKADIAVCCAFRGREKQLDLAIAESQFSDIAIVWILMGSDDRDAFIIKRLSTKYENVFGALCDNLPVGAKWQACVDLASDFGVDFELLCISGSDDLIAAKGFDYVFGRHQHNVSLQKYSGLNLIPAIYCTNIWHIYNVREGDFYYKSLLKVNYNIGVTSQPLGSARFYTRLYLEEINRFLFDCSLNKNLDNWGYENLISRGKEVAMFSDNDVPIVSIKVGSEMNNFETILNSENIEVREAVFRERSKFFTNFEVDVIGFRL